MYGYKNTETIVYYTWDGQPYPLHTPPTRTVLQSEGLGMPPVEYVTDRSPFQHGTTVRSFYLSPRAIQLVIMHNFCSRADYWEGRNTLLNTLRPMFKTAPPPHGTLIYTLSGGKRRALDCYISEGPGFTPLPGWQEWSFTEALKFTANDPTWYDPVMKRQTLLPLAPLTDLIFPATFPIVFSESAALRTFVTYTGTWLEYPTIEVTGPITGFHITNTTNDLTLGLSEAIPDNYTVTFDLHHGLKTVIGSDGANWLNRLSSDSDLSTFCLWPAPAAPDGVNNFLISGTGTNAQTRIVVAYYERYVGI